MKIVILGCFFWLFTLSSFAQKLAARDTIIRADTINVRGIIYDYNGNPVKNMNIVAQQYNYRRQVIKTDTNGYFEVKGADPNGGLNLMDPRYFYANFSFKSRSRYIVIYLPEPYVKKFEPFGPIVVTVPRVHPKVIPAIKEELPDPDVVKCFDCGPMPPFDPGVSPMNKRFNASFLKNLPYPPKALENNIEGTVELSFIIAANGQPTDIKILKGLGYGCDEEIIDLIKKLAPWHPGMYNGRPTTTPLTISVEFKLTEK